MTDKKSEPKTKVSGFYKGYDIKWLKSEPHHPDFYLVAEYEALEAKKK